jgi:hypothetical protein
MPMIRHETVRVLTIVLALASASLVQLRMAAVAWADTPPTAPIGNISLANLGNALFRVSLAGVASHCNGATLSFAYIDAADDVAKVKISGLLTAYALQKPVGLLTEAVPMSGAIGCRIIEFWF